jgi:hypothetical protein
MFLVNINLDLEILKHLLVTCVLKGENWHPVREGESSLFASIGTNLMQNGTYEKLTLTTLRQGYF